MRIHWLACACVVLLPLAAVRAEVILTVEAPGVQVSQVPGVTTETFNSIVANPSPLAGYTSISTAVGTLTGSSMRVLPFDQYGGADGVGNYWVIGRPSGGAQATLTLNGPQGYVGMWLSALDPQNGIAIYSGDTLLASYNAAALLSFIGSDPAYKSNPNPPPGRNANEQYAYLNFIGTNGTTFDNIRFTNPTTTSGLEIDNISIAASVGGPPPGTEVPGGTNNAVPLPSVAGVGAALLALLGAGRGRRRQH